MHRMQIVILLFNLLLIYNQYKNDQEKQRVLELGFLLFFVLGYLFKVFCNVYPSSTQCVMVVYERLESDGFIAVPVLKFSGHK
ncbi:hypothetical protein L6452_29387 [Arctium lappa]|uniref:Uncharacterized protein n=1 Tax=Arctium lappa TaxID=4217 RepID=A0ACB8ZFN3_ARCLA|nr:hypothetical protein L6452_29387 [Arctium lappa]